MKLFFVVSILFSSITFASSARTVFLNDKKMQAITVAVGRSTILSFPSKPTKVILGNQGMFALEYVENDLAVAALKPFARSNLFVYLEGRRFGFELRASAGDGDQIVLVRDSDEKKIKIRIKNE